MGSYSSSKKNPEDIDFAVVVKVKKKSTNLSLPIDIILVPENDDVEEYLDFFSKYMKKKYGSDSKSHRLK